jgi:aminoglycoside 2'-N-acetyltransferase I
MPDLELAHTSDLDAATLAAARGLLEAVFEDDPLTDADWEHGLGGIHALVWEDAELVGHASVIQRRLIHRGSALRTGYVECVGVRADRRRRGHGSLMMAALGRVIRGAYELGALGATDEAASLYAAHGWELWRGPTSALTVAGVTRTPDADGCVWVLRVDAALDLDGPLVCDWRDGDVW